MANKKRRLVCHPTAHGRPGLNRHSDGDELPASFADDAGPTCVIDGGSGDHQCPITPAASSYGDCALFASKLPENIKELFPALDHDTFKYLSRRGVLALPSRALLSLCLSRYVEFVHPVLPVLELNATLVAINDETGASGRVSLLLLLAMIYASMPFVELVNLQRYHYTSKIEARLRFYERAKVSHNFASTRDVLKLTRQDLAQYEYRAGSGCADPV